ncbi:hypothetical protein TRFO_29572 [Tritrichomonas foetus]|uniref:Protein kinase domain-containing protein n=1 Tax=Tritrichomonas foetus TaxID=1144522 RepID=A0A1J4JZZ6_9EUKA|nr:hypothetical protein TRFO_29572 [Tritrichomonas foetus]|eukprot:OHT03100.1 hypothetical protein TRFO_29572 [Tritrichomonas foetus]
MKSHEVDPSNYEIESEVNKSTLGATYKVRNKSTDKMYISFMSNEPFINDKTHLSWTSIAEQFANKPHPNLVKLVGYSSNIFRGSQNPMIINELLEMKKLSHYFSNGHKFSNTQKQKLIFGIVSGLRLIHQNGITHRELTPSSIFLNKRMKPIISNYSASIIYNTFLLTHVFTDDSLPYYAPESFKDGVFNEKTDVYSFGIVLYQLLTGEKPYSELKDKQSLKVKVPAGYRPAILISLPFQFQKMIERCCDQDPARRPDFARLSDLLSTERYTLEGVNQKSYDKYIRRIRKVEHKYGIVNDFDDFDDSPTQKEADYDSSDEELDEEAELEQELEMYSIEISEQLKGDNLLLFQKALKRDPESCYVVYKKLLKGRDRFPYHLDASMIFLKIAADLNYDKAVVKLANLLNTGTILPTDLETAASYYKLSSENGNIESSVKYGIFLFEHKHEIEESKEIFKAAMDEGNLDAKCYYAKCIENDDFDTACDLYEEAAQEGNVIGLENYERTHQEPPFNPQLILNYAKLIENENSKYAIDIYKRVADFGDIEGSVGYGRMLEKGDNTMKPNLELAANFYLMAASMDSPSGNYNYGRVLQYGIGVRKDIQLACNYFLKGAILGDADAMTSFGKMLESGIFPTHTSSNDSNDVNLTSNINSDESGDVVVIDKKNCVDEAAKYYRLAADSGNATGMENYARFLELGCSTVIPKNINEAARFYKMAADHGNSNGMFNIARMLQDGIGTTKNLILAFKYFMKASEAGNTRAMNSTGFMLKNGFGTVQNDVDAIRYFKLGAKSGNPIAMNNYAEMLEAGRGVHKNMLKALKYYKLAAKMKNPNAMNSYGRFIENGFGVTRNLEEAIELYKQAALARNPDALYNYARMLETVIKDYPACVDYYKKAAMARVPLAMKRYSQILENGEYETKRDIENAVKFIKFTADAGDIDYMEKIALIYEEGKYVKQDLRQSARYYRMAAENQKQTSIFKYAFMLENGIGVPKNISECMKLYKKAADLGNVEAMNKYANLAEEKKDFDEAVKYYCEASTLQSPISTYHYGRCYEEGIGIQVNMESAAQLYKKAADLGCVEGMLHYALCLTKGAGVTKNMVVAYKYFRAASDKGSIEATTKVAIALKHGVGVSKDIEEAALLFKQGAEAGNPVSMLNYGSILETDNKIDEAIMYYRKAADQNVVGAYFALANLLEAIFKSKNDTTSDFKYNVSAEVEEKINMNEIISLYKLSADKANNVEGMIKYVELIPDEDDKDDIIKMEYLSKASELKDYGATFKLGQLLEKHGDKDKALKCYKISSEHEYAPAYQHYARLSHDNEIKEKYFKLSADVSNDMVSAYEYAKIMKDRRRSMNVEYLKISAESGILNAIMDYAQVLEEDSKIDESKKFYKIAADKGDLKAMLIFAEYSESIKNNADTLKYYKMASDKGDPIGMFKYGESLEKNKKFESAMILFNKSSALNVSDAFVGIGRLYENGNGVRKNYNDAFENYKKAADLGNPEAHWNLGRFYENGIEPVKADLEEAFKQYKKSAKDGNVQGLTDYARCLLNGTGIPEKNEMKALKYYKILCQKGDQRAMYHAATILIKSDNIEDKKEAVQLFKAASDLGDIDAMFEFACLLKSGVKSQVLLRNRRMAAKIFKMCADMKHSAAMLKYSIMADKGIGVPRNKAESIQYLKLAADYGNSKAIIKYVQYLRNEGRLDESLKYLNILLESENLKDRISVMNLIAEVTNEMHHHSEAAQIFKENADHGNIEAMINYAKMAAQGTGIEQDKREAASYYRKAADLGNVIGMLEYAKLSQHGFNYDEENENNSSTNLPLNRKSDGANSSGSFSLGDPSSSLLSLGRALSSGFIFLGNHAELNESAQYFKKAADLGNSEAMYNYAKMCARGLGVDQNVTEAFNYYMLASDLGDYKAMRHAAKMLQDGTGIGQNLARAEILYQKAAKHGNDPYSMYAFATILEKKESFGRSARYYKMAADKGVIEANVAYGRMLETGLGVDRNYEEAANFYYIAADAGNPDGLFKIGEFHYNGTALDKRYDRAFRFFKKAADKGHSEAAYYLARMAEKGRGTEKSKIVAMKYYKKAADLGNCEAMMKYAGIRSGKDPATRNLNDAKAYYIMAAENGLAKARDELRKVEKLIKRHGGGLPKGPPPIPRSPSPRPPPIPKKR